MPRSRKLTAEEFTDKSHHVIHRTAVVVEIEHRTQTAKQAASVAGVVAGVLGKCPHGKRGDDGEHLLDDAGVDPGVAGHLLGEIAAGVSTEHVT